MANSENDINALNFSHEESFGLFMEGLRSLQHYEDEASREQPRKLRLVRWMQDALGCLRQCVCQFPNDLLPHFYLGVVLAMRNQEVYVDRVQRLASACISAGRALAFRDLASDPELTQHERDFAQSHYFEDFENAHPYRALEERPWPLLEEASRMFGRLLRASDRQLQQVAAYNLAQIDSRRGTEKSLNAGLKVLNAGLKVLKDQDQAAQSMPPQAAAPEERCLALQFECLQTSLVARLAMIENKDKEYCDTTFALFQSIGPRIEDTTGELTLKADLTADFFTKEGYIFYERALCIRLTGPSFTAEECVEQAASKFSSALELKEHWNPAQIYLAVIRRIQCGLAEAHSDFLGYQIKEAEADRDLRNGALREEIQAIEASGPRQGEGADARITRIHREVEQRQHQIEDVKSKVKEKIESFNRRIAEKRIEKGEYSTEADELFAVLQGLPLAYLGAVTSPVSEKPASSEPMAATGVKK